MIAAEPRGSPRRFARMLANVTANRGWLSSALIRVPATLLLFSVARAAYLTWSELPHKAYFRPVIALEMLRSPTSAALLIGPAVLLVIHRRRLAWTSLQDGQVVRVLVIIAAGVLAWSFATYDYNLYLAQGHVLDRVLLLLVGGAVWLSPTAVALFLPIALGVLNQLSYPIGGNSFTDKAIVIDVLILLVSVMLLHLLHHAFDLRLFVFLAGCLFAANYVFSGVGKLGLGWLSHERIGNLLVASHLNGWLGGIDRRSVLGIAQALDRWNIAILLGTLVVEIGAVTLWWFRGRRPLLVVGAVVALQLVIFAASGIFFWKWIAVAAGLGYFLTRVGADPVVGEMGGRGAAVAISAAVILATPLFGQPTRLAWLDSRINTTYELVAVPASSTRIRVGRAFMAPHEMTFAQNRFAYLDRRPVVVGTYGSVLDRDIARSIANLDSCSQLVEVQQRRGVVQFDAVRAQRFDRYIRRFVQGLRRRGNKEIPVLTTMPAPRHIWTSTGGLESDDQVVEVQVVRRDVLYDGRALRCGKSNVVRTISTL